MSLSNHFLPKKIAVAVIFALSGSTVLHAEEASKENSNLDNIEKIVVSARGRTETLQQIPDSVTVFSDEDIKAARITTIKDFSALTPNLNVSSNFRSGLNFVTVRGLITPQVGEAPIAYVVDGITVPNLEFINQGLHDIERIEVLRGPQGALYGKNAIGGAINIVTKQATDELEGSVQASIAEGSDKKVNAAISGPMIEDKAYYRLSANYQDFDGLIDNNYLNETVDYVDGAFGTQGMLKFYLSDDTALTLNGSYSEKTQGSNYMAFITKEELEDFSVKPDANAVGLDESTLWSVSAKLEQGTDYGDLTLIAAANDSDIMFFSDGDFTHQEASEDNFYFPITQINPIEEDASSAEARFTSPNDDSLRWSVGAYYEAKNRSVSYDQVWDITPTERVTYQDVLANIAADPSLVFIGEKTVQESSAYAVFGQTNYDIKDDLELTLALRYDSEERDAYDERDPSASKVNDTFSQLQPKASIAWQMTAEHLLYSTYSKGFRSGGFNEYSPAVIRKYEQEISDTVELGLKTTWLDGALWLNMSVFHIEQQDAQFTRLNPTTFTLENLNIDEVAIDGFELEMSASVTDDISINFGLGLIDNEITKNTGIDILSGRDLAETEGGTMPYVSDFNLNGSIDYSKEAFSDFVFKARLAFNTLGPRSFDIFNDDTGESDAHTFVNANIAIENQQWSVSLFASNLTDEASPETVFLFNPLIRMRNQPRQVGVQARYNF
ncbi:TonB-dependent receptor [Shewanella sp. 10N.286.52.C2]|uniref:TonB-dependent receptor n=1 Tax=unclassified Shewanella TaxID=196818 RepID=UPI000C83B657|nr:MULTISPECIES: TonB-dependent receptor [unclassified Shewanella]MDO6774378.1 TonB-dependent receptor [Shewanella sp. 3_MG-2023]PMG28849.1 TonB-dependent receptor [Shewanella sp. 10N.286.52.C2]